MFPTLNELADYLSCVKGTSLPSRDYAHADVRLQVTPQGWVLLTGDPSYDTDHRGFWGFGELAPGTNVRTLALGLIAQAREDQQQEIAHIDSNMY